MKPALDIRNLTVSLDGRTIFSKLNLSVQYGRISVLCGPSGVGKTTLLKCLTLLERPEKGTVFIGEKKVLEDGKILDEETVRNKIGIVFQDFYLWDNKTVLENVTEALIFVRKMEKSKAEKIAKGLITQLQLQEEVITKYPPELSRGQRQRVAIARTLAMEPDILLLDEPTASLDEGLTSQVAQMIKLLRDIGKTILIVTHDLTLTKMVGDEVFNFKDISK